MPCIGELCPHPLFWWIIQLLYLTLVLRLVIQFKCFIAVLKGIFHHLLSTRINSFFYLKKLRNSDAFTYFGPNRMKSLRVLSLGFIVLTIIFYAYVVTKEVQTASKAESATYSNIPQKVPEYKTGKPVPWIHPHVVSPGVVTFIPFFYLSVIFGFNNCPLILVRHILEILLAGGRDSYGS